MVGNDLKPGDTIRFIGYAEFTYGTIIEHVPSKGGYMVRPDGYEQGYGFGYSEIERVPFRPATAWERIDTLELTDTGARCTMRTP